MDGVGGGRRRAGAKSSAEDQALDQIAKEAEERLRAKRLARAEAKEIRMRELERQQKEQEENADRQFDMLVEPLTSSRVVRTSVTRFQTSRRSSEDSLEDGGSLRELRHELKEWEDKFRKAMVINAQLDNEKSSLTFQVELLKDRIEEIEEEQSLLRREHRDKCREHDQLKRLCAKLKYDLEVVKAELDERDRLIKEQGLVIVTCEDNPEASSSATVNGDNNLKVTMPKRTLVKMENAKLLEECGDEGNLDDWLSKFAKEKSELIDEISHLKLELEEEKSKKRKSTSNGPLSDYDIDGNEIQNGSSLLADYKFRAQKAEQDVATLQATIARLESQVVRYKSASEASEKLEETLKSEKRKLQREAREALSRAEELETANLHLLKRLDKLKNAKSALLKEL